MILSVFITVISGHDKPQPPGCLLEGIHYVNTRRFGEKMGEASDLLDGVDNGLRYLLDCKAEWNQILDSF
nr:hypothetical protein BMR31_08460 [Escherichia coli]